MTYYLVPVTEQSDSLTLGRTRKVRPPPWYKRGGGGLIDPPLFFDMLQYCGTILPSVESP